MICSIYRKLFFKGGKDVPESSVSFVPLTLLIFYRRWDTVTRFLEDIKADLGPDVSIRVRF